MTHMILIFFLLFGEIQIHVQWNMFYMAKSSGQVSAQDI